jgi:hypothetical protein
MWVQVKLYRVGLQEVFILELFQQLYILLTTCLAATGVRRCISALHDPTISWPGVTSSELEVAITT